MKHLSKSLEWTATEITTAIVGDYLFQRASE